MNFRVIHGFGRGGTAKQFPLLHLRLSLGLFFGWMLSFAISGPILPVLDDAANSPEFSLSLVFLLFHAAGLVLTGFFLGNTFRGRALILPVGLTCTALYIFFWFGNKAISPVLIALMALASAFLIMTWGRSYIRNIEIPDRVRFIASVIFIAALVNFLISIAAAHFPVSIVFFINALPLAISIRYFMKSASFPEIDHEAYKNNLILPPGLFILFCILVFGLNICGGLQYSIMVPYFSANQDISLYFRQLPYFAALGMMIFIGHKVNKMLLVYFSTSFVGLSFIAFILCYSIMGAHSVFGYIITETLIQLAFGFFDVFTWALLADIAMLHKKGSRIFGFGLAANVLAIFTGGLLGARITSGREDSYFIAALIAVTSILLTIILVPFLSRLIENYLLREVSNDNNLTHMTESPDTADIAKTEDKSPPLPLSKPGNLLKTDTLTPREAEITARVLEGLSNRDIAVKLGISDNTLKTHMKHIYGKMGVSNKRDLFMLYIGNH
jgi:DNA-binding CsgD family transcriptional regulator